MSLSNISSLSRSQMVAVAGGLAGAAFIGYCIYFDHKRRSAPDYKHKVLENRRRQRQQETRGGGSVGGGGGRSQQLPNINNPTEMQAFFLQEVQLGEELLSEGDTEGGVEHLANAITMCGQPQQLLQIFQQTLPPQVYARLIETLPDARQRIMQQLRETDGSGPQMMFMAPQNADELIDPDLE
uniref:Mitochondrial import receptor subunit TOM20 n=1 Tax=Plectus sambesii TaxID=2011161 RepID=A0A914UJZ0_9BILA